MIKLKKIIKEAFGDRKFGEPLPTFTGVMNDYQAGKLYTDKDKPPFKTPNQIEEETITEAKVSDVKKMEKMADKIVADMLTLNKMFVKIHDVKTSNPSAYRTFNIWKDAYRDADAAYGGWFEYVYDSDNVEK